MISNHDILFMVVGVSAGTLATMMAIAWLSNSGAKALLVWAFSMACACGGLLLYVFTPFHNDPAMALAFGLEMMALTGLLLVTLDRVPFRQKLTIGVAALLCALLFVMAPIAAGYNGIGLIIYNIFAAAILFVAAWRFQKGPEETPVLNRLAVIVGAMVALSFLVCAVMLVVQGELKLTKRPDSWAETVNGLLILLGLGALTGHWLALHQRRLVREHELNARTDALTGLLNRRGLADYFDKAGLQPDCAVILFDLDHFKTVNDVHGHSAGDAVLREFANVMRRVTRAGDILVRNGGEEFLLILPQSNLQIARTMAEDLRTAFAHIKVQASSGTIMATVSAGVAMVREQDSHPDDVIRRADVALYQAKDSGRNRVMLQPTALAISANAAQTA